MNSPVFLRLSAEHRQLYNTLQAFPNGVGQDELLKRLPGWSLSDIGGAINSLSNKFIEIRTLNNKLHLAPIPVDEIEVIADLNGDEIVIYNTIKSSGNKGMWKRDIRTRTGGMAQNVFDSAMKKLESKHIIKDVKSVRNPTRKYYMLSKYEPAEEVVGGTFFSENELDEDLVHTLIKVIYEFISRRTRQKDGHLLPLTSPDYPNASDITNFINEKRVLREGNVKPTDIQTLLDKLVFQGSIIKFFRFEVDYSQSSDPRKGGSSSSSSGMALNDDDAEDLALFGSKRIKTHDSDDDDGMGALASWCYRINPDDGLREVEALMEIPCGKCPVFQFCSEDGPVSPSNCQYFKGGWFKS